MHYLPSCLLSARLYFCTSHACMPASSTFSVLNSLDHRMQHVLIMLRVCGSGAKAIFSLPSLFLLASFYCDVSLHFYVVCRTYNWTRCHIQLRSYVLVTSSSNNKIPSDRPAFSNQYCFYSLYIFSIFYNHEKMKEELNNTHVELFFYLVTSPACLLLCLLQSCVLPFSYFHDGELIQYRVTYLMILSVRTTELAWPGWSTMNSPDDCVQTIYQHTVLHDKLKLGENFYQKSIFKKIQSAEKLTNYNRKCTPIRSACTLNLRIHHDLATKHDHCW